MSCQIPKNQLKPVTDQVSKIRKSTGTATEYKTDIWSGMYAYS